MFRLVEKMIDEVFSVRFTLRLERPRHAIDEGRGASVTLNLREILEEFGIAIGDHVHPFACGPVAWLVNDAASLFHSHSEKIRIQPACMQEMHLQPQRLPATDLMIEFSVGPSETGWVSNYANLIHCETIHAETDAPVSERIRMLLYRKNDVIDLGFHRMF